MNTQTTLEPLTQFNALVLIDCWDIQNLRNPKSTVNQFYKGIIDFTKNFNLENIFFCSGYVPGSEHTRFITDKILEHHYTSHRYVFDINELLTNLEKDSTVLVGGAAWHLCLHDKPEMNFSLLGQHYRVYSHPKLVDSQLQNPRIITDHDFISDSLPWEKRDTLFYLDSAAL